MGVSLSGFDSAEAVVDSKLPLIKYQIVTTDYSQPSTSRNRHVII